MIRWCALCERRVEGCEHFEEPPPGIIERIHRKAISQISKKESLGFVLDDADQRPTPSSSYGQPTSLHQKSSQMNALRTSLPTRAIGVKEEGEEEEKKKKEDDRRSVWLPVPRMVIPAFSTANISIQPQHRVDLRRLVYSGPRRTFALLDLSIGRSSIFGCPGASIAMETFPPYPPEGQPIDNLDGCDLVEVNMLITICVQNLSPADQYFDALIYARVVESDYGTGIGDRELRDLLGSDL